MNATQNDRLAVVDALRGFALLGILMVNIGAFSSTFYGLEIPDPKFVAPFDRAVQFAISALFETKFYLLFSFLFGYSFTLQMSSSERTGRPFAPQILRRLATLWVIGLIHAALLYHGDILTTYALLGLVLLAARVRDVLASAGGEAERDGHVEVRIWIAPDGVITQAAAPADGAAEVQASLRALLEGRRLAAPPKRMTQPLRIGLQAGPALAPSEPPKAAATR